jgi:Tol biopolymer transport system component
VTSLRVLGVAVAASVTALLSACAGSDAGSPDLLLVSTRDGDYAIYGMSADGGNQKRLTDARGDPSSPRGLFFQTEPAWSPDGSRIAFASKREGSFDIYSIAADGSDTRRLTTAAADESGPSWSSSGQQIVFSRGTAGDLYVMNADGTNVRPLVTGEASDTQPAWSPDGRWIAFVRRTSGTSIRELWLVRPNGTGARRLTSLEAVSEAPAWSPDSTRVAFATDVRNVQFDIYSVGVDGEGQRRLTVTADDSFEPAWAPDGATIAYTEGGAIHSKEVAADPYAEGKRLTDAATNDSSPDWRPAPPSE